MNFSSLFIYEFLFSILTRDFWQLIPMSLSWSGERAGISGLMLTSPIENKPSCLPWGAAITTTYRLVSKEGFGLLRLSVHIYSKIKSPKKGMLGVEWIGLTSSLLFTRCLSHVHRTSSAKRLAAFFPIPKSVARLKLTLAPRASPTISAQS